MIQDCGRKVNDGRKTILRVPHPKPRFLRLRVATLNLIHKQNPRHGLRINDVISTPFPVIVFDQRVRESSDRALPRNAKSGTKVHQQIGGIRSIRTRVDFLATRDTPDRLTLRCRIDQCRKPGAYCVPYALGFSSLLENSLSFTAFKV